MTKVTPTDSIDQQNNDDSETNDSPKHVESTATASTTATLTATATTTNNDNDDNDDKMARSRDAAAAGPGDVLGQLPEAARERLAKEESWLVPAIVTRAFNAAGVRLRAKVLSRLLRAVGPLALTVVGGGVFARYVQQARWSALSVSFTDAARVTSSQIYELATYVQQSNPEVTRQILTVLSRDVSTMTALGATIGAIAISYLSGRASRSPANR